MLKRLKRLYRSRGHGIHSPFAYHFVTGVIGERGGFYAYDELATLQGDRHQHHVARLLHRVAVFFNPAVIGISGELPELYLRAVELSDSRCRVMPVDECDTPPGLIVVAGSAPCGTLPELPRSRQGLIFLDRAVTPSDAMSFSNGEMSIVVRDSRLPSQHFEVNL